jgi:hypothetical protein
VRTGDGWAGRTGTVSVSVTLAASPGDTAGRVCAE